MPKYKLARAGRSSEVLGALREVAITWSQLSTSSAPRAEPNPPAPNGHDETRLHILNGTLAGGDDVQEAGVGLFIAEDVEVGVGRMARGDG